MNKLDLVAQVAMRLGVSRRVATDAVDAVVESIIRAVANGEKVSIPGFGSFEKRLRSPRTARNPRTGAKVIVPATSLPAFRPGKEFRAQVAGPKRKAAGKRPRRPR